MRKDFHNFLEDTDDFRCVMKLGGRCFYEHRGLVSPNII